MKLQPMTQQNSHSKISFPIHGHSLVALLRRKPEHIDFRNALTLAHKEGTLSDSSLKMIEGVLNVSKLCASDIMVPRSQIKSIDVSEPRDQWIRSATASGHSRFPVIDGDFSKMLGLLHAKDILRAFHDPKFRLEEHLRIAKFVPESMPLNNLLKEFQQEHQHLALVVDEFGEVSGLLTIEDVLEQIVGDIDDEFDTDDPDARNIIPDGPGKWKVRAVTLLEQFNEFFGTSIEDPHCETIGGIVTDRLERVPKYGDAVTFDGFQFTVLSASARRVKVLLAERLADAKAATEEKAATAAKEPETK